MPSSRSSIAVMGAGAVGSFFGAMLARAGHPVTLIGRPTHVAAIRASGLCLRRAAPAADERVDLQATSDPRGVAGADIVLVCVKSGDSESAARAVAPHLARGAVLFSLQNGVDNAERIARFAARPVVPAIVYVAAALAAPGVVAHFGRGDLVIGALPGVSDGAQLEPIASEFTAAGIPVRIAEDIARELWAKLVINCAYNPISALGRARYAAMLGQAPIRQLIANVVAEVVAVGRASGVGLDPAECLAATLALGDAMPNQRSSTYQDLVRGKPTEIDALNGFVVREGARHGIRTPLNSALHALVKLLESQPLESP